tara:strand:- start:89 stop:853 length:765 start_codon:yes stop_codon:yes gene_type:complete
MPDEMLSLDEYIQNQKLNLNQVDEYLLDVTPDYLYPTTQEAITVLKSGTRVFGEPAAALTWGIDGNRLKASLLPGIEGEKMTAKALNTLTEQIPGLFVFHSLSWPESHGDTDHILVYKDLVILIDSKRWKAQRKYSVTDKYAVKRGTVAFPEGRVKIGWAAKAWKRKLPGNVTVRSIITIAQEKVYVVRDKNWYKAPYRLVEAEKLVEQVTYMINHHNTQQERTSGTLLTFLMQLAVKPKNLLDEILNKEALER